ncbi:MAG: NUDIX domain-containing protein [Pseudomonadota bacterium]|nr:NUDIX domain-containing protein [Pseudomonadota bacterium]
MALKLHNRLLQRGYLAVSRITRGMTLGVRAMLLTDASVFLVRHSYMPGWYLPGGGVEAGESIAEALAREIMEEAGAALTGPPELFGVYRNRQADRRDHVALFVCRAWEQRSVPKIPNREIVAADRFRLDALPAETTPATRARIKEVLSGAPPAVDW